MDTMDFEELDHTADIAIRVRGGSLAVLFENAADGMMAMMTGQKPEGIRTDTRRVVVHANGADELLREWLSEIIFLVAVEHLVPIEFHMEEINEHTATALIHSLPMTEDIARRATEIKAVTWHGLCMKQDPEGFTAEVVFDT